MKRIIAIEDADLESAAPVTRKALGAKLPPFEGISYDAAREAWKCPLDLHTLLRWASWNRHSFNEIAALGWFGALEVTASELTERDFSFLRLDRALFKTTTLVGCSFEAALLEGAHFQGCSFKGCKFDRAQLTGAAFTFCSFEGCTFLNATLPDTKFTKCKGLEETDFRGALRLAREGRIPGHTVMGGEVVKNALLPPSVVAKKGGGRK